MSRTAASDHRLAARSRIPVARTLLVAVMALTSACATVAPPQRPVWNGTDEVGNINDAMIVGRWALTLLNPLPGQQTQTTRLVYQTDGTVRGILRTAEPRGDLGELAFELAGHWQARGEWLVHSDVRLTSRDGSVVGRVMSRMFNRQAVAGRANVYARSANRLLMVGDDGQAIRYDRLE